MSIITSFNPTTYIDASWKSPEEWLSHIQACDTAESGLSAFEIALSQHPSCIILWQTLFQMLDSPPDVWGDIDEIDCTQATSLISRAVHEAGYQPGTLDFWSSILTFCQTNVEILVEDGVHPEALDWIALTRQTYTTAAQAVSFPDPSGMTVLYRLWEDELPPEIPRPSSANSAEAMLEAGKAAQQTAKNYKQADQRLAQAEAQNQPGKLQHVWHQLLQRYAKSDVALTWWNRAVAACPSNADMWHGALAAQSKLEPAGLLGRLFCAVQVCPGAPSLWIALCSAVVEYHAEQVAAAAPAGSGSKPWSQERYKQVVDAMSQATSAAMRMLQSVQDRGMPAQDPLICQMLHLAIARVRVQAASALLACPGNTQPLHRAKSEAAQQDVWAAFQAGVDALQSAWPSWPAGAAAIYDAWAAVRGQWDEDQKEADKLEDQGLMLVKDDLPSWAAAVRAAAAAGRLDRAQSLTQQAMHFHAKSEAALRWLHVLWTGLAAARPALAVQPILSAVLSRLAHVPRAKPASAEAAAPAPAQAGRKRARADAEAASAPANDAPATAAPAEAAIVEAPASAEQGPTSAAPVATTAAAPAEPAPTPVSQQAAAAPAAEPQQLESVQDEEVSRAVFIKNLPFKATREEIIAALGGSANVERLHMFSAAGGGTCRGAGFVVCRSVQARQALLDKDGDLLQGRAMRIAPYSANIQAGRRGAKHPGRRAHGAPPRHSGAPRRSRHADDQPKSASVPTTQDSAAMSMLAPRAARPGRRSMVALPTEAPALPAADVHGADGTPAAAPSTSQTQKLSQADFKAMFIRSG